MAQQWTVGKKLFSVVGVLAVLILVSGGIGWWTSSSGDARFEDAYSRAIKVRLAADLKRLATELLTSEKIIILAGYDSDQANIDKWTARQKAVVAEIAKAVAEITPLIANAADKAALAEAEQLAQRVQDTGVRVQALVAEGKFHEAQALSKAENTPQIDKIATLLESVEVSQVKRLDEAKVAGDAAATQAAIAIISILLMSLGAAVATVLIVRSVSNQLRAAAFELRANSEQVLSASSQVASSSQTLSQGATEQAASLEETSASMEEMASMTRRNADGAAQAATLVFETEAAVRQSNESLSGVVTAMGGIRESSGKISKIIKTIDEIAFQTNILALNAAVEAARAGEAGMGFAVVADEVRNLAQRSAQAAKDTAGLIEDAISRSEQGSAQVEQMATVIGAITDKAGKVKSLVDEIAAASRQQTQGIDQVSQAVSQMEKVTQNTAATAEESAAASEELSSQAEMSMQTVSRLEAMVGSGGHVQVSPTVGVARQTRRPAAPAAVAARADGKVVQMKTAAQKAEDVIPLDDTGTFGKF